MSASSFVQFIVGLLETFLLKTQASSSAILLSLVRFWSKSNAKSYTLQKVAMVRTFYANHQTTAPFTRWRRPLHLGCSSGTATPI